MPLSGEEEGEQVSLSGGTLAKNNRNKDVVCMIEVINAMENVGYGGIRMPAGCLVTGFERLEVQVKIH